MINPSDVKKLFDAGGQVASRECEELYANLMDEEHAEVLEGVINNDRIEKLDGGIDLVWVTLGFLFANGFTAEQISAAWDEVARSNMSKIDPATGMCIKNEAGKIMKPAGYFKPNLSKIIGE